VEEEAGTQHKDTLSKLHMLQVTGFADFIPTLLEYLVSQASCFKSGRLASFIDNWRRITSDKEILQMVSGQYIEFDTMLSQKYPPAVRCFSKEENTIIKSEVSSLLKKAVIVETAHEPGEFISPIFVRRKKMGHTE